MPVFSKYDTIVGGTLTSVSSRNAEMSSMYVEIIGDGFGDASLSMAQAAYETARKNDIPILIPVKDRRKAKHPEYAREFLEAVEPRLISCYTTPPRIVDCFATAYERAFKSDIH